MTMLIRPTLLALLGSAALLMQCGFDDPSYFSRSFKQAFGQTPKTFRTQQSEA